MKAFNGGSSLRIAVGAMVLILLSLTAVAHAQNIPRNDWTLRFVDSQELTGEPGAAINCFDGNAATFWHTAWSSGSPPQPHEIQIGLGDAYDISGFRYLPRQDGGVNGRIARYEFYVSADGNSWGAPVATGSFVNDASEKTVSFASVTGSFIRLRSLSEVNGNPWTSMAELNVVGISSSGNRAPNGTITSPDSNVTINVGQSIHCVGSGSDPDGNLPLSFSWRFGSGSGIPDSTLETPGVVIFNTPGTYSVVFTVTDALGLSDPTPATRMITVLSGDGPIPRAGWSLRYTDSQEIYGENGAATNSFDGNSGSIWHTGWSQGSPPCPHEIQIDLGQMYDISGFRYQPRQDGSMNGRIGQYEFYISLDGVNWGAPAASGTFANNALDKEVTFTPATGQFIRLRALTEVNGNPWTSMAEINVLGSVSSGNHPPNGVILTPGGNMTIYEGESVLFSATGSDSDGNLPLSYVWQFGAGSGIPDSQLESPGAVIFSTAGTYVVTCTVTDATGFSDPTPATRTVTVRRHNSTTELIPDWTNVTQGPFELLTPPGITNPVLTRSDVTDMVADFIADPFLFHENGTWYMFFEVWNEQVGVGRIAVATSIDGLHWQYDRVVLSAPHHLAFPSVIKHDGRYFMIPDTWNLNEVRVFESTTFPYNWQPVATLISGRPFTDPSIFRYNDHWWMFVGDISNSTCYLYHSDDLLTGWIEHPRSPIVGNDASRARPGGRSFVYGTDHVIRIAQNDVGLYGTGVRAFHVDTLDELQYAEHEIPESPLLHASGIGWNELGMHNFDPWWTGNHWLAVADGLSGPAWWTIGIYVSPDASSPNGTISRPAGNVTIYTGDTVDFAGVGSDPDGNVPLSYVWQFGAGSGIPDFHFEMPGLVQFNTPGIFTVTFTVSDAAGFTDPIPATRTITVLSGSRPIPQAGWTLRYVDSQELVGENGAAANAFDGNPATIWHTEWSNSNPPPPHEIQIDLGGSYQVDGFHYLPRQDGGANGRIGRYEFYVSSDGTSWGSPVASGTFVNDASEKSVSFAAVGGRFVRLRALSEVNGNPWTSMGELRVFGN